MSLIKQIIKAEYHSAPKGIVYGSAGIGKTTFAARARNSLIIDCENGAGAIQCQRTPYLQNWDEIYSWLKVIETEDHGYGVIAIDSLDWLVRRIEEHVAGCGNKVEATLNKSHGGYGNGKQVMQNYIYQILLPMFDRIINRDIAIIFLAHAKRTEITDIDGITIEKTAPDIPDHFLNVFIEWSDFVCLAFRQENGERWLLTEESARALAKNRYNLSDIVPLDWESFCSAISEGAKHNFTNNQQPKQETK